MHKLQRSWLNAISLKSTIKLKYTTLIIHIFTGYEDDFYLFPQHSNFYT